MYVDGYLMYADMGYGGRKGSGVTDTGTISGSSVHFVLGFAQHYSKTDYRRKSTMGIRLFSMSKLQSEYCTSLRYAGVRLQSRDALATN